MRGGVARPSPNSVESDLAASHKYMLQSIEPCAISFDNSPTSSCANSAICVAFVQQGRNPTLARRANPFSAPGWARVQDPSRRTKIEPSPTQEPKRASALWYAITEYPSW